MLRRLTRRSLIAIPTGSDAWFAKGIEERMTELHELFGAARTKLREMGQLAGVEIEPESQTALLVIVIGIRPQQLIGVSGQDATMEVPGVLAAGVPGGDCFSCATSAIHSVAAGGFDAVFVISTSKASSQNVERIWRSFEEVVYCALI